MEPVSTSFIAAQLGKLALSIGTEQLRKLLQNKSQRRRIAAQSAKAAGKEGIQVQPKVLRGWLSRDDVQQQLLAGRHESIETAIGSLAWRLDGSETERTNHAVRLVGITCHQYLVSRSPQEAVAVSSAQAQALTVAEGRATRDKLVAVENTIATLVEQLGPGEVFEEDLLSLHAFRASEARGLSDSWPPVREVVHLVALSRDRPSLLRSWVEAPPQILHDAPGAGWCWAGIVAADYGEHRAAVQLIARGIERGVADPGYWWARAALATPSEGGAEQSTRDVLANAGEPHPLGLAQQFFLDEKWFEAQQALTSWETEAGNDRAIKALLLAESVRAQGQLDGAIEILERGCEDEPDASGPMLHLAELLLARGYRGHTVSRFADFTSAQARAVQARNSRRQWGGDSVAAALTAIKASALATDLNQTWRFTQIEPDGDATATEAADPRLRREAAILAAMTMRTSDAGAGPEMVDGEVPAVVTDDDDSYTAAMVAGYHAYNRDDTDAAHQHWLRAWKHAMTPFTQLQVARSMAPLGLGLPDLDGLLDEHADMVDEIRVIHDVMAAPGTERLTKLRVHSADFEQIAVLLAEELSNTGHHQDAGDVLKQAAQRWDIPLLMKMAADRYHRAGEYDAAVNACRHACTMAGPEWAGEFECRLIEFNSLEAAGREDESEFIARRLTTLAPDNDNARWMLVDWLGRHGNVEGAFHALNHKGRPIRPRNRHHARNWVILLTQADHSPHYLPRVLDELAKWRDDEEIAGIFLANLAIGLTRRDAAPDEAHLIRLHATAEEYFTLFPESTTLRRFDISETDPLGVLGKILGDRYSDPQLLELHAQVADAKLPLGVSSEVHAISYAEAALRRAAGFVHSHVPAAEGSDPHKLLESLGSGPAVLDTTAGVTLLGIDSALRETLLGRFAQLESTGAVFRDARTAQQSLVMRSTISLGWDPDHDRPQVIETSVEEANDLADRADRLVQLLTTTNRREWQVQHFGVLGIPGAWLNVVDYAVANNKPFWSDDLVLRALARQAGCTSFGTVELIRALAADGVIDAEAAVEAQATLLTQFHATLGFEPDLYRVAAAKDEWRARGVAASLTLVDTWGPAANVLEFVHVAAEHHVIAAKGTTATQDLPAQTGQQDQPKQEDALDDLRNWVGAAAVGLAKLPGDDIRGASNNLHLLLVSFVARDWMNPALLRVIVEGVRQALAVRNGLTDPLHEVLVSMHRLAAEDHGDSAAAYILLHWAQHLSQPDKHDATMIAARRGLA